MPFRPNPDARRELDRRVGELLIRAAVAAQSELTTALGRSYPPASRPGEFPARRTGNLQSAVMYEPANVEAAGRQRRVRVGYAARAWYGAILELKRGRKGLRDVLAAVAARIKGIEVTPSA
jgi:hypothetical protein